MATPTVYSTARNSLNQANLLDVSSIKEEQVWPFIQMAKGTIDSALNPHFDVPGDLEAESCWATIPIPDDSNTGTCRLLYVNEVGSSSITEGYRLTFTTTGDYTVFTDFNGCRANGNRLVNYSIANYISIRASEWTGIPAINDTFYFSIICVKEIIWRISVLLSTADMIDNLLTKEIPASSEYSKQFKDEAESLLTKLQTDAEEGGSSLGGLPTYKQYIQRFYSIDEFGNDTTPYAED